MPSACLTCARPTPVRRRRRATPTSFAANDTEVHTVVRLTATARATGKQASMDLHHLFRFRDGKVAFYRGTEDTLAVAQTLST
jgi:ketosteroid isomerase-like protein